MGHTEVVEKASQEDPLGSYRKGGKVPRTGIYKLHAGERVLNAKQTRKFDRGAKGKKGERCMGRR